MTGRASTALPEFHPGLLIGRPLLHHEAHVLEYTHVPKRIAARGNDVGPLSRTAGSEAAADTEEVRVRDGRGVNHLPGGHPVRDTFTAAAPPGRPTTARIPAGRRASSAALRGPDPGSGSRACVHR